MKIQCSAVVIETPQKSEVSTHISSVTKSAELNRSSPNSYALMKNRCHQYMFHNSLKFEDLRQMCLDVRQSGTLSSLMKNLDEKGHYWNKVKELENEVLGSKSFTTFLQSFVSEQLCVPVKHSFAGYIVFQYSYIFKLDIEQAFHELFSWKISNTSCEQCYPGIEVCNTDTYTESFNRCALQKMPSEMSSSDDSFKDPDYIMSAENSSTSLEMSISDENCIRRIDVDKFEFSDDVSKEFFNPFINITNVSQGFLDLPSSPSVMNTSVPVHSTPIKAKKNSVCQFCEKDFGKQSNLKTHLGRWRWNFNFQVIFRTNLLYFETILIPIPLSVSVHKIFPNNACIFKCPAAGCSFVSNNKIHFNRHSHRRELVPSQAEVLYYFIRN